MFSGGEILKNGKVIPFSQNAETYFRVGLRHAEKRIFGKSLKYLEKAAQIEPFNPDYLFNLATVHAELKQVEKSNKILLDILKYIDPTLTECYFGIGCNYFDLGDLKKAREYFEKYIYYDPEGQFSNDAYDILYYMRIYDETSLGSRKSRTAEKLASEGRKLLNALEFDKACSKLEAAIEIDPEAVETRNYLSIACFVTGNIDRAISIAKSILLLQPENLFSHCNLALLYAYSGNEKELDHLAGVIAGLSLEYMAEIKKLQDVYEKLCKAENCVSFEDIRNAAGRVAGKISQKSIKWKKEWDDVIQCALQNREFIYKSGYEKELKNIWMNFIKKVYPAHIPVIKKREVWAAALEYIYCNLHLIRVSKSSLAKKYKVSPSSIANKLKDFSK